MNATPPSSNPLKCVDLSDIDVYANDPVDSARYRLAVQEMAPYGGLQWKYRRYSPLSLQVWLTLEINRSWSSMEWKDYPWDWNSFIFRINPSARPKEMVPWDCLADLERSGARYLRSTGPYSIEGWSLIIGAIFEGIYVSSPRSSPTLYRWSQLGDKNLYQWSADLKTWHPFTKERVG